MVKVVKITFSNKVQYYIPAEVIAEHRAENFAERYEGEEGTYDEVFEKEYELAMNDRTELLNWASNMMNWEDVEDSAVYAGHLDVDKHKEFINADKEVQTVPEDVLES